MGSGAGGSSGSGGSFVFYRLPGQFTASPLNLSSGIAPLTHILVAAGGAGGLVTNTPNNTLSSNGAVPSSSGTGADSAGGDSSFGSNGLGGTYPGNPWTGGSGSGLVGSGTPAYENGYAAGSYPYKYADGFNAGGTNGTYGQGIAGFGGGATGSYSGAGGGGYSGGGGDSGVGSGAQQQSGGGGGSFVHNSEIGSSTYSLSSGGNGTVRIRPA